MRRRSTRTYGPSARRLCGSLTWMVDPARLRLPSGPACGLPARIGRCGPSGHDDSAPGQLAGSEPASLKRAEQRWSTYVGSDVALLSGQTLLHTDYNPYNVLVDADTARLVDWAWPTLGAAFIDPCCLIVHLMMAGHTAGEAKPRCGTCRRGSAHLATGSACSLVCSLACGRRSQPPIPRTTWKQTAAGAALAWAEHRSNS